MSTSTSTTTAFTVPAMDCAHEFALIRRALGRLDGVHELVPNYVDRSLRVDFNPELIDVAQIQGALRELGFPAEVRGERAPPGQRQLRASLPPRSLVMGGAVLLAAAFTWWAGWADLSKVLCVGSALISGGPILKAAARALSHSRLDMNALMCLAAAGALLTGDFFESATAMFLFSLSLWLESYSLGRARHAVRTLVELTPRVAHQRSDGQGGLTDVDPNRLRVGDVVMVRPGERLPVDGVVLSGSSAVNEALLTGESMPVEKSVGAVVFAGSLNGDGSLEVRATTTASDSRLAHVARLVEQAQTSRSPSARFIDEFAARYTPVVISLAILLAGAPVLLNFLGVPFYPDVPAHEWIHRGLVLLVIACPCAMVISTPVTLLCALHRAASLGVVVKGGEHLEALGRIRCFAFDKTGTLTEGRPHVVAVIPQSGIAESELLEVAAALESHSEHPVAAAIVAETLRRGVAVPRTTEFQTVRGAGIRGRIDAETYFVGSRSFVRTQLARAGDESLPAVPDVTGAVWVSSSQKVLGAILIADRPREDASMTVATLHKLGIRRTVILTGDSEPVAKNIANAVGVEEVMADLLPSEKVVRIKELLRSEGRVAMVGDGVNDAPALATSTVGIALGTGASDTALETADVIVLSPHLSRLPDLIRLSRRTRSILGQNLMMSIGLKIGVFLLASLGLANMWMAVGADVGAGLLVILNGMRLLPGPLSRRESV